MAKKKTATKKAARPAKRTKPPLPDTTGLTLEQVLKAAMETPMPVDGLPVKTKKKSKTGK